MLQNRVFYQNQLIARTENLFKIHKNCSLNITFLQGYSSMLLEAMAWAFEILYPNMSGTCKLKTVMHVLRWTYEIMSKQLKRRQHEANFLISVSV